MINDILNNNNFKQVNDGDTDGSIWSTKNINPETNHGKVQVSKVFGYRTDTVEESNLTAVPTGFAYTDAFSPTKDGYYCVAGNRVWQTATTKPNSTWDEVSGTPTTHTFGSDIAEFNSKIYVAGDDLDVFNGSTWSTISGGLNGLVHSMAVYANKLYISDNGKLVYSMTTGEVLSKTGTATINLDTVTGTGLNITSIRAVSNGIWIAATYERKQGGEMIFWDGETENKATNRYKLSRGALALTIKDDRPYILDSKARLRVFDGTSFTEIAKFPVPDGDLRNFNISGNDRFIHPNGMVTRRNEIYFLLKNERSDITQRPFETMPSGIWAYSTDFGLYHKHSFTQTQFGAATTGTVTDFGASELVQTGALEITDANIGVAVDADERIDLLAGVQYYTDATNTNVAIGFLDGDNDVEKGGYLTSTQLQAEEIGEVWQDIVAYVDKFKNSTDKLIIKFRTSEDDPVYVTGRWSADDILRSDTDMTGVSTGDEVEILRGKGAGLLSKITSLTNNNRMVLKDTISGMSGTCTFRVQKWKEINRIDDQTTFVKNMTIGSNTGGWVQYRVFMVGAGKSPQLQRLVSVSKPDSKFNN